MLEYYVHEGIATGICTTCGTPHESLETDAEGVECEECETPTVSSPLILAGVI